jgi:cold shock CspA family protein
MRGEMLWFNEAKEYGFIRTDAGERLYVHRDGFVPGAVPVGRCAGKLVDLQLVADDLGRRAVAVSFVDERDVRRARPRRGSVRG